eukprot:scaffold7338_cov42-Phaeocystis_antarctica.AAC.1
MAPGASRAWAAKGAMKTSRPVDARLWAAREDPGLHSELGAEYTRPTGGCHEHAARFGRHLTTGEGPGLTRRRGASTAHTQMGL